MAVKRLRVKRKETDCLKCTFTLYPKPHSILEAEIQHKDKRCCGSFPLYGADVMDADVFEGWVVPYLTRMLLQLKEATTNVRKRKTD